MDAFTNYALIEDGRVIEYPVNPREFLISTGDYNIPLYWRGGMLGDKLYVFCHDRKPVTDYTEIVVETTPYFDSESNMWYRGYEVQPAPPELIEERLTTLREAATNSVNTRLGIYSESNADLLGLSPEQKIRWAAYRAEVQNLPNSPDFPHRISWPPEPDSSEFNMKLGVTRI
jgi:hypothetical protein